MIPRLSDDQRQAIKEHGDVPVHVVDARTNEEFVIMRVKLYEKVKPMPTARSHELAARWQAQPRRIPRLPAALLSAWIPMVLAY